MISDGIYRLYKVRYDHAHQQHRRLAGRLLVANGQIQHLEDHHSLQELIPEGPVTPQVERRFKQLSRSGYHELLHEEDISRGEHPDEFEDLDVGAIEPEHRFIMTGDGLANPAIVEMWDDAISVDGRRVDDTEAHQMLGEVAAGRLVLTPLD